MDIHEIAMMVNLGSFAQKFFSDSISDLNYQQLNRLSGFKIFAEYNGIIEMNFKKTYSSSVKPTQYKNYSFFLAEIKSSYRSYLKHF